MNIRHFAKDIPELILWCSGISLQEIKRFFEMRAVQLNYEQSRASLKNEWPKLHQLQGGMSSGKYGYVEW
jgi:hypothetical protein